MMKIKMYSLFFEVIIFFCLIRGSVSVSAFHDDHESLLWCLDEDHYDSYDVAIDYLQADTITDVELDVLIQDAFDRMGCSQINFDDNSITCSNCLKAENIYQLLNVQLGHELEEDLFHNASTIILTYLYRLNESCKERLDWATVTYGHFTRILLDIHDDLHDHDMKTADDDEYMTSHQLESLMRLLQVEYIPGRRENVNLTTCAIEHQQMVYTVCSFGNTKSFSSYDVESFVDHDHSFFSSFNSLSEENHDDGIHEYDLGLMSSIIFTKLLSGECISRFDDGVAVADDFVRSLFQNYADEGTCDIDIHGLEELATVLKIGVASDEHDDHDHLSINSAQKRRIKRDTSDDDDHDHGSRLNVDIECFSMKNILLSFEIDEHDVLSKTEFTRLCPALLQQASLGCRYISTDISNRPSDAEIYGYGTLAIFVISSSAAFAIIVAKWRKTKVYKYILTLMLALGVGALVGDAFLHLVPQALSLHNHSHSSVGGVEVDPYIWKMLCGCISIWLYYNLQLGLFLADEKMQRGKISASEAEMKTSKSENDNNNNYKTVDEMTKEEIKKIEDVENTGTKEETIRKELSKEASDTVSLDVHIHSSVAWMVTIGDSLHNFADGLAVGAAFTTSWQAGLSTSIAVFAHEVPHEFGDVAMLLSTGWPTKKVMFFQLLSQSFAFIGLYVGISITTHTVGAQEWIFAVAAGMFVYVALADVIPELIEFFKLYSRLYIFVLSNVGLGIGFLILLLIAIFEERIAF